MNHSAYDDEDGDGYGGSNSYGDNAENGERANEKLQRIPKLSKLAF